MYTVLAFFHKHLPLFRNQDHLKRFELLATLGQPFGSLLVCVGVSLGLVLFCFVLFGLVWFGLVCFVLFGLVWCHSWFVKVPHLASLLAPSWFVLVSHP